MSSHKLSGLSSVCLACENNRFEDDSAAVAAAVAAVVAVAVVAAASNDNKTQPRESLPLRDLPSKGCQHRREI